MERAQRNLSEGNLKILAIVHHWTNNDTHKLYSLDYILEQILYFIAFIQVCGSVTSRPRSLKKQITS